MQHCPFIPCAGSSPRGRGTGIFGPRYRLSRRFIPAWAGNRHRQPECPAHRTVHPRVGGEQVVWPRWCRPTGGSSPRGRGTAGYRFYATSLARFIPAWAGNRPPAPKYSSAYPVHPRVGGEQGLCDMDAPASAGSSPRGRGTGCHIGKRGVQPRFIPAWAGNRQAVGVGSSRITVHPRVGGEQAPGRDQLGRPAGSSPRGRGTGPRQKAGARAGRFIPAWAGNRGAVTPGRQL